MSIEPIATREPAASDVPPLSYDPAAPPLSPFVPLAQAFRTRLDDPLSLLKRQLARLRALEPAVQAFVVRNEDAAEQAAAASSRRWAEGRPLSLIDGMTIGVKDVIETRDFATQMNSPLYTGWHGHRDAACVRALRAAGAIILGKTVTTEFACSNSGPTRLPFDFARTPGGSSSGSGAAVGAGMVTMALGTQTQASTIRPASFNGAWGLKPSHGAIAFAGIHPLAPSLDTLGIIAASAEDLWASSSAMAAAAGADARHRPLSGPLEPPAPRPPQRLVLIEGPGWAELDKESVDAFVIAVEALRRRGVEIASRHNTPAVAELEEKLAICADRAMMIFAYESRWPLTEYADRGEGAVGARILQLIERARALGLADYERALAFRRRLRDQVDAFRGWTDGFLTLAASGPAIVDHAFTGSRLFPTMWTLVGAPAVAMPSLSVAGLPLGLQLCGFDGGDCHAVATARAVHAIALAASSDGG